ncbi:MAG: NAD(P)-dependent oxidoreductase [Chloroflexota bacterium]|jgi:phosphoglycerate dehydrogenase-like enzyme
MPDQTQRARPVVLLRPSPQITARIFSQEALRRLHERYTVIDGEADPSESVIDSCLPDVLAIIGQPDLPRDRIERAPNLRGIFNVEGNFFPNVDYEACFERGINVAVCAPVYAQAVAEFSLGLALDLARGISREDRAFREGREGYVFQSTGDSILLRGAEMGILGYGNIGRKLLPLLEPFRPTVVRCYDPWLPDAVIRDAGMVPAPLDEVLATSTFLFILATVTSDSTHLLNADNMRLIPPGARVVLTSRAAVVDFEAMVRYVAEGRFLAATDVWPEEPAPADHPARTTEDMVLQAHRAGGLPDVFPLIGEMVLDDLALLEQGLPPVRNQLAARELVGRYRSKPVQSDAMEG